MPLFISFSQQDFQTRIQQSQQAGYERGYSEGLQRGLHEGAQKATSAAIASVRRFYQEINEEIFLNQNRFQLTGAERIEDFLLRCLTMVRIEHATFLRLELQVAEEDRKIKLALYDQNQEEIKRLKNKLEQQEQLLTRSERSNASLERQNVELQLTIVGLQNTLDGAFKQGK